MPGPYVWYHISRICNFLIILLNCYQNSLIHLKVQQSKRISLIRTAFSIWYGAYRSIGFQVTLGKAIEETNAVKLSTVIVLPIVGSIFLIVLFFFLHWIVWLLLAIVSFMATMATSFVVYPYLDALFQKIGATKSWNVRWLGDVSTSGIASLLLGIGLVLTWFFLPYFFLTDTLAVCMAVMSLAFIRIPNMKIATVLLSLFFLYDIFWVFISEYIFTKNVMITVATSLPSLPMVIVFPRALSEGYSLLGLGDIILPGLFLCYLYRMDKRMSNLFWREGYFIRIWVSYIFALVLTVVMVIVLNRGQPALLYLVPFTLIPTALLAWKRGELRILWTGSSSSHFEPVVSTPEDLEEEGEPGLLSDNSTTPTGTPLNV